MFTLAKSCLRSATFKFEVMTVYMFVEEEIKNKCAGFENESKHFFSIED
jgi:hypothetical protein